MARKPKTENEIVVSAGAASPARRKNAIRPRRAAVRKPAKTELAAPQAEAAFVEPSREEVAALAYSYWEGRGCQGGCPEADWLRAEQELRSRGAASRVATA